MNVSDYIIDFFIKKGICDFFGYQGTMIVFLVDAIHRNGLAHNHSCYNEQGAAFAACGYAQATGHCAVAYATSGPGAINLLNGVADAWADSKPVIFITGQINTTEYLNISGIRQQGFQEIDIVSMSKPITKYSTQISRVEDVKYELEKAWYIANNGRKGPVLLDLPMNIQRTEIDNWHQLRGFTSISEKTDIPDFSDMLSDLSQAKRPLILVGNGIDKSSYAKICKFVEDNEIPVVTTLLGKCILPEEHSLNFGVVGGAYGHRSANLLVHECDFLLIMGASMCTRQTGTRRNEFASNAKIYRYDIDAQQLKIHIHEGEVNKIADINILIERMPNKKITGNIKKWVSYAQQKKNDFLKFDDSCHERLPNKFIQKISEMLPDYINVVSDVGQHMMWISQSFHLKEHQKILFSGGLGAMGYSIPAAIGAYYATNMPSIAFCGDGSFQMNIQELQWIIREQLPILIVVLNNRCLGMIRSNQADFIGGRYEGSCEGYNYSSCNITKIAEAYGFKVETIHSLNDISQSNIWFESPMLIEVQLEQNTIAAPKTYFGEPMWNQRPYFK